jgi:hypothetical protein
LTSILPLINERLIDWNDEVSLRHCQQCCLLKRENKQPMNRQICEDYLIVESSSIVSAALNVAVIAFTHNATM